MAGQPVITRGAFDSQNLAFWDSHAGRYREYHRMFRGVRDIMTGTSNDFLNWTEPRFLEYPGATPEHLYTNTVQPYPGAPHILIGFPTRFLPTTQQTEPTFMVSRDGATFRRYAEAIIPITAPANRDGNRSNYMAWGLVELPGEKDQWSVYANEAYYTGTGTRLRRFTYRKDGLAALTAGTSGGEAISRPIQITGSKLIVNYKASDKGSLRIELQDAAGQPLPGYTAADSRPLTGDSLLTTASWTSGADVSSLSNQPLRLRFLLTDAELFSFRFE
jgi:hypothetical protein